MNRRTNPTRFLVFIGSALFCLLVVQWIFIKIIRGFGLPSTEEIVRAVTTAAEEDARRRHTPPNPQAAASIASEIASLRPWKIAFVRNGNVWVALGDGSDQRQILTDAEAPCWSPDHKRIAFAHQNEVWVAKADGSEQRQLTHKWTMSKSQAKQTVGYGGGKIIDLCWDAKDNAIVLSHWEEFQIKRKGERDVKTIQSSSLFDVSVDFPGAADAETYVDILDSGAGFHTSVNRHPAMSSNGQKLAFVRDGDIWIASRNELRDEWSGKSRPFLLSSWGWDVTRLAATAAYDASTDRASRENCFVTHLDWSPDGKHLVYGVQRIDGSGYRDIQLINIETVAEDLKSKIDLDCGCDPCFSPDGNLIAYEEAFSDHDTRGIRVQTLDGKVNTLLIRDAEQPAW